MSDQRLDSLISEMRADFLTLPAVQRAYQEVPDAINQLPAVIVAAMAGTCWPETHMSENGSQALMCLHAIRIEIHVSRKDLARASADLTAIADDATTWLWHGFVTDRFNGTMITPGDPRTANNATAPFDYSIGPSEWAGLQTYAWVCDFAVTTQREIYR